MKVTPNFTPGPWEQNINKNGSVYGMTETKEGTKKGVKIAQVESSSEDAQLIATAPDMYYLLEALANSSFKELQILMQSRVPATLRKAIKK